MVVPSRGALIIVLKRTPFAVYLPYTVVARKKSEGGSGSNHKLATGINRSITKIRETKNNMGTAFTTIIFSGGGLSRHSIIDNLQ